MQFSIYVVVCQSGTAVSKIIKAFTRKPYNHVSVSGDKFLTEMYSFCRTYKHSPIPACFNKEVVGKGVLGMFNYIPCEIYEISVTYEQKKRFDELMSHFKSNREKYSYNYLGLWNIMFKILHKSDNKFVCSQFGAYVVASLGIELPKPLELCTPEDMRHISSARLFYRGDLISYYYNAVKPLAVKGM